MTIQRTTVRSLAVRNKFSLLIPLVYTIFQHTVDTLILGRLRVSIYAILYGVLKYGIVISTKIIGAPEETRTPKIRLLKPTRIPIPSPGQSKTW